MPLFADDDPLYVYVDISIKKLPFPATTESFYQLQKLKMNVNVVSTGQHRSAHYSSRPTL